MRNQIPFLSPLLVGVLLFFACSKTTGPSQGGGVVPPPVVTPKKPVITAISPDSAVVGTSVIITGTDFDTAAIADTVRFNGVVAVVGKATATQLTVTVPATATTGNVTVTTKGGVSAGFAFTVTVVTKGTVYVLGSDTQHGWGLWTNSSFAYMPDLSSAYDLKGSGADIYIAGPSTAATPTYWKNGSPVHLTSQTGFTWSIFVSGTDVYNLGIIGTTYYTWKNGSPTQLSTSSLINFSYSGYYNSNNLFVYNGDVYVAGAEYLGNSNISKATYWKNGVPVDLTDGIHTGSAWANAVVVSGGDVYVAGIESITNSQGGISTLMPRLWKNGVSIPINAPTPSFYNSVACMLVNGSDVYVGGQYNNAGAVWKNGVLLDSAKYAVAEHVSSMFLYNNKDLYFSGASSAWGLNGYWINGNFVEMDPGCQHLSNSCAATFANQASAIYVK